MVQRWSPGSLEVGDFGLVKRMAENNPGNVYAQTMCGTPTYMAPEVLNNYFLELSLVIWKMEGDGRKS